jgi:hypothetical protein
MNRRGFLGLMAAAAIDPELLLWVPGRKLISIPKLTLNERMDVSWWETILRDDLNVLRDAPTLREAMRLAFPEFQKPNPIMLIVHPRDEAFWRRELNDR